MTAGRSVNSISQEWCTPNNYVRAVKRFFDSQIDLDPCSNKHSIVHARMEYTLPKNDGLKESWNFKKIYVNPPYGADREKGTTIKHWLYRCAEANRVFGSEVIALIPVASNTSHWKEHIWSRATSICFLYDTRLRFLVNGKNEGKGAPMSCAIVYWGDNYKRFLDVFLEFGAVIDLRTLKGRVIGGYKKSIQPSLRDNYQ
ncbi:N-6 DNA methylase [Candidatus Woesearchaeota archaeon]|nr:N-6 DNA methylase [Candidatus Woesearchaeota archaeon]